MKETYVTKRDEDGEVVFARFREEGAPWDHVDDLLAVQYVTQVTLTQERPNEGTTTLTYELKERPARRTCKACQPNSKVRQHTCGLRNLQELLPQW